MNGRTLVVLGAVNVDLVVSGARLPATGETVVGGSFAQHQGGKGGNQAVAAARALGPNGRVAMIGAVGNDAFGDAARDVLTLEGVDVDGIITDLRHATGIALITVDPEGRNRISVASGANASITPAHVEATLDAIGTDVAAMLVSLEIPMEAALAGARWCHARSIPYVLNPAPARPEVHDLLPFATHLTPNEHEILVVAAQAEDPRGAVARLVSAYPDLAVVATVGAEGAIAGGPDGTIRIAGTKVRAIDATGAGDCFNGIFAAGVLEGRNLQDALTRACAGASLSVTVDGAREGMPSREQIDAAAGR